MREEKRRIKLSFFNIIKTILNVLDSIGNWYGTPKTLQLPTTHGRTFYCLLATWRERNKRLKRHRNAYQFQCMHYQATPTIKSDRPELRRRQLHPEEMPSSQSFSIHLWMCSSVENSYLSFYQSMDERRTTGDIEPQHALVPATSATTYLCTYLPRRMIW